ncbi:uncharacterized protein LOC135339430 isoform X3 [Halichondria panicea]|uniref:uncharacterized protein LOC135339389 isoform X3 n=1 Tax=Halichondria panicea TaxID=6063 RepID=UPI00312BC478
MNFIASQTTALCIVVGLFLTITVIEAQKFTIEPESVIQAEGLLAKFECLSPGASGYPWFVDGTPSVSPDFSSEIKVAGGTSGRPSVLTIPASSQFNNSVIQCAAFSLSGAVLFSRIAILTVERVILVVLNGETKITVSVMNNFTMNNLAYRVDISLVPLVTNEMVALPPLNGIQNQVQFNYQQLKNHTVCDTFTFTVTPITSESGMEGNQSEPVTGFFTQVTDSNVIPLISQGGNVLKKIVHLGGMVPNCTNFTSYQVTTDILVPINKTIEDPQMINFSLPTDQIINISVTLTSITGVRLIFKDMLIRTTDVQNLIVHVCPQENCASIEYVESTLSPGALLCVIRIIDGELDFQSTRLVPIRRHMSDNFTIPVAVSGKYSVVAFDLENNNMSVPRMPISIVADDETTVLSNESSTEPSSPPNSEGITVTKLSNGSAEVTCTTSGQSCLALFQSKTSLDLMVVVGFIEPPNDRTVVSLDATSDVYVVVYTWNSDSGETIFDGKVSFIDQLELRTSPPRTQSPPDSTESPSLSSPQPPPPIVIIIVIVVTLILVIAIIVIVIVILYRVKKGKRGNKVLHSSYIHELDEVIPYQEQWKRFTTIES